ncbi:tetratricopeptide repeat-containing glycosyltransferase family 2 protein [Sporosarcina koreensis]|uniref:tetratricopeptide repeat-containing glycosyltransferase family 2 protein n=1 Tax=Sporosarcina koreensis TaxID=334735 RepID=UPI0007523635|nr:glycosyltransferase [Sporosarcina koreensis]
MFSDHQEISLCMIVRDEEKVLERCLRSVSEFMDEIIIVDTGSVDGTREIAEKYADKVLDFAWVDDFAAARNYSFANATKDYIMWLDADDVLQELDRHGFRELKEQLDGKVNRVSMPYHLGVDSNGNVTHSLRRNRIVRREAGFRWVGKVHEYLEVFGDVIESDVAITHQKEKAHTPRNLEIYLRMHENQEPFSLRDTLYFANELMDNDRKEEAIIYFEKFLSLEGGWLEDNITACLHLSHCYKNSDDRKSLRYLFKTFEYDKPRAEACSEIGRYFIGHGEMGLAVFWLEMIFTLDRPHSMGIANEAVWTWMPHIDLCYCYDQLGQFEKAYEYHMKALSLVPDHPSVLFNEKYFEHRFNQ